jgi:hypothetical protein
MVRVVIVLCLLTPAHLPGQPKATSDKDSGDKLDLEKMLARCVDSSALVFGPEGTKEPRPIAGALVLDREKHLLLGPDYKVPDDPTVVFPAYTAKGELRNRPSDYVELWKKGERWKGKVLHRDKERGLVVIELDRAPPERARPAEFAQKVQQGITVYSLAQLAVEREPVWELSQGAVRAAGKLEPRGRPGPTPPKRSTVISTVEQGPGPEFGLFDRRGWLVALPALPFVTSQKVNIHIHVDEAREFLTEKKVPFKSAEEPAAKDRKAK